MAGGTSWGSGSGTLDTPHVDRPCGPTTMRVLGHDGCWLAPGSAVGRRVMEYGVSCPDPALTMAVASARSQQDGRDVQVSALVERCRTGRRTCESVASARGFVTDLLGCHDLSHLAEDVRLAVSELATNAVLHARTGFTVTLGRVDELIVLEVSDDSEVGLTLRESPSLDTNGRGIVIVQALSRDWGVNENEGGGKSVWANFVT